MTTNNTRHLSQPPIQHTRQPYPQSPRAFAATGTWSELACSAPRHIHGSASRNSQQAPLRIGTADFCGDPATSQPFPNARPARKMCNLALADAEKSSVFQALFNGFGCRFRPMISADGVVMVGLYAPVGASDQSCLRRCAA